MKHLTALLLFVVIAICAQAQNGPLLLGMTEEDGTNEAGTIFSYTGGDTVINGIFNFPPNGFFEGPLSTTVTVAGNGKIYGLAAYDGDEGTGSLFEYNYGLNTYTVLASFDSATGQFPGGALIQASNGLFYGLTSGGGDSSEGGTLFSYTPGDTSVVELVDLPGGAMPLGSLVQAANGKLYGITNSDGTNGSGTIFQYDITGGIYTVFFNFPSGAYPSGNLLQAGPDTLYGLTTGDGLYAGGTMFRYVVGEDTDTVVYNFTQGAYAASNLMRATNGMIYGLTNADGANSEGTIFSYNIDSSTFNVLYSFGNDSPDGIYPVGGLMQASDGKLYGTTDQGGLYGSGTIFNYDINTSTYSSLVNLDVITGDYPGAGYLTEYKAIPVIAISPASDTACNGGSALFIAMPESSLDTLHWQVSSNGGASFTNIAGATDSILQFITSPVQNGNLYRAIFTNAVGSDTTSAASLDVVVVNDTATVNGAACTAAQSGAVYQWFDCGGGLITGATAQSYTATVNGSYRCNVVVGECADTTNCVQVTVLGIADVQGYDFALFPNPTSGICVLSNSYGGTINVQVRDILGNELKEFNLAGNRCQFDITGLAAGVYEVIISNDTNALKVLKLVKE